MADTFTITALREDQDGDVRVLRVSADFVFGIEETYTDPEDGSEKTRPRMFTQNLTLAADDHPSAEAVRKRLREYAKDYRAGLEAAPAAELAPPEPPRGFKSLVGQQHEV